MKGADPIRRTYNYLKAGTIVFKNHVKIMEYSYNLYYRRFALTHMEKYVLVHKGMHNFHHWDIPQIQFANPNVQIVRFLEKFPTPFIRCWLEDGTSVMFDTFNKDRASIVAQLRKTLGKTPEFIRAEKKLAESSTENYNNPALFGFNKEKFCICEIPGKTGLLFK